MSQLTARQERIFAEQNQFRQLGTGWIRDESVVTDLRDVPGYFEYAASHGNRDATTDDEQTWSSSLEQSR